MLCEAATCNVLEGVFSVSCNSYSKTINYFWFSHTQGFIQDFLVGGGEEVCGAVCVGVCEHAAHMR